MKHGKLIIQVLILILCLALIFISICYLYRHYKQSHDSLLQMESEISFCPPIMAYGSLYWKDKHFPLLEYIEKWNIRYQLKEVIHIDSARAYILCYYVDDNSHLSWRVLQFDLYSQIITELFSFNTPQEHYQISYQQDYKNRNAFFHDNQLILTDHRTVLVYDLFTGSISSDTYGDYKLPSSRITARCVDANTIYLQTPLGNAAHSISHIKNDSTALASISDLAFFDHSVQIVNDQIYVIAETQNVLGESYAVIIAYSETEQHWYYVDTIYTCDTASRSCYIVPYASFSTDKPDLF